MQTGGSSASGAAPAPAGITPGIVLPMEVPPGEMDIEDATSLFRQLRETSRAQKHERWRDSMF